MKRKIVLVDDDLRLSAQYAMELESAGFDVQAFGDVDNALAHLRSGAPVDAVVWDMAMPPGREFADGDHQGGFRTGFLFYEEVVKARPGAILVLLTAYDNDDYATLASRGVTVRMKTDTDCAALAELLHDLTSIPRTRGTA